MSRPRQTAVERMARGYAARPPGPNVTRALAEKKAEREEAAAQLKRARAARLARRNKDEGRRRRDDDDREAEDAG